MSQEMDTGYKTFRAGEALAVNRWVKVSSDEVVYADSTEAGIGVTTRAVADGELVSIKLASAAGTLRCSAAAAVAQGAPVYIKDNGQVDDADAGSEVVCGVALEAAGAANDVIEVLPALQL